MSTLYQSLQQRGLAASFYRSLRRPEYWAYSSWLQIATKYRRTSLGLLWLCLPMTVFIIVLGNVYSHLMHYTPAKYLPYLGVGYALWRFIVQVVNDAVAAFTSHKPFVMEGSVPLTDFILLSLTKAGFNLMFAAVVIAGIFVWSPEMHVTGLLTLLYSLPLLVLNLVWIAVCVALMGARFPDTREVIGTILVVGLLVTPILWPVDKFPADTTRGLLVRLNPAFHLIDIVRAPLLGQATSPGSYATAIGMCIGGWLFASVLFRRYSRYVPIWL